MYIPILKKQWGGVCDFGLVWFRVSEASAAPLASEHERYGPPWAGQGSAGEQGKLALALKATAGVVCLPYCVV